MGSLQDRIGGCLCRRVTYRASGVSPQVLQCHCENCRRLSGNYVAAVRVATDDLAVADPRQALSWHELGYARYGFCRECGATLFYRAADRPHVTSVMVGSLDDASGLEVDAVWFTEAAQPHNTLPAGVPHHIGNG